MRSKILIAGFVLIAIIVIGVGVGLLAGGGSTHIPPGSDSTVGKSENQTPSASTPEPSMQNLSPIVKFQPPVPEPTVAHPIAPAPPETNSVEATNNWEEKIDDIVGSDESDTNKVQQLLALFPTLPPDGQEEAAQHLSNLVDDEDYAPLGELLKNDKLPEGVLDELLADVLNRPNALKLPLLLNVASDPNHIKHDEAKDLLELYLGEDYGADWNSWGQHMTNWMQQNPE